MFENNVNECVNLKTENDIISKIILHPPECFKKNNYIENVDNKNISNDLISYVIKNKIYSNATQILSEQNNKNIYNDYNNKMDILLLCSKYDLPPMYILNIVFKIKYNKNILFIKNNINILDDRDYKNYNKAKYNDIYTLDSKMDNDLLLYKEFIKQYLYSNNIHFIENEFWFEPIDFIYNNKKISWIYYTNKYGSKLKRLYNNIFDTNLNFLLNLYESKENFEGIILYSNNYCCDVNSKKYFNINFPINNDIFSSKYNIININKSISGDFYKFGLESKTDKITHHHYYNYYPLFLENYRKIIHDDKYNKYAMIEIGINQYRSLKLWNKYFPESYIYGLDIGFENKGDNYKIFKCDQSDLKQLKNVSNVIIAENKKIFFIVDDGSHYPEHQIKTFNLFFDKLLSYGGCYIIEDIETSYWTKNDIYGYKTNYGYKNENSVVEIFKKIVDDINYEFLNDDNKKKQNNYLNKYISEYTRQLISGIFFGQNNVIILKKSFDELVINKRSYRFKNNL